VIAILIAGCAHAPLVHHAELRVEAPADVVRDVARAVLIDRYHAIADEAPLVSAWSCFTDGGDRCVLTDRVERVEGVDGAAPAGAKTRAARHLELSVRVSLAPDGGRAVMLRVSARVRVVAPGDPDDGRTRDAARDEVPIWVEREIDQTLAQIRARIGDDRERQAYALPGSGDFPNS
jgi:hypothetical protein